MLGGAFLLLIIVVTLVSMPWTFGHETLEGVQATSRRFEATHPESALQPAHVGRAAGFPCVQQRGTPMGRLPLPPLTL